MAGFRLHLLMFVLLVLPRGSASATDPVAARKPVPRVDQFGDSLPKYALARMGTVRFLHPASIGPVLFTPDSNRILTGCNDGRIYVWDRATGKLIRRVDAHRMSKRRSDPVVSALAISPDGKYIASAGEDWTVALWRREGWRLIRRVHAHTYFITSLAFSADGRLLASGSYDGTFHLSDGRTGRALASRKTYSERKREVIDITFSPDGQFLLTAHSNAVVQFWSTKTYKRVRQFGPQDEEIPNTIYRILFSPDGTRLLISYLKQTRVVDVKSGKTLRRIPGGSRIAVSSNFDFLAVTAPRRQVWNPKTGKVRYKFLVGRRSGFFREPCFSPDGRWLAEVVSDPRGEGSVVIFDGKTGRPVLEPQRHLQVVTSVAFSPHGKTVVSGSRDDTVRLWDARTGKLLRQRRLNIEEGIARVAFSPDGRRIGIAGTTPALLYLDPETLKTIAEVKPKLARNVTMISRVGAFSGDLNRIMTLAKHNRELLWKPVLLDGKKQTEFETLKYGASSVAISASGNLVAWSSLNARYFIENPWELGLIRVRDLKNKRTWTMQKDHGDAVSLAFSADETMIAAGHRDGFVRVWKLDEDLLARPIRVLAHVPRTDGEHEFRAGRPICHVEALAFSPNGKLLATGARDGRVRIWDIANVNLLADLTGHASRIGSLAFSPDGKKLASGGYDGTVLIWDVNSAVRQSE